MVAQKSKFLRLETLLLES